MKTTRYEPIPGFPGYVAGDDGSVWSSWRSCGRGGGHFMTDSRQRQMSERIWICESRPCRSRYRSVTLRVKNGSKLTRFVHQLILMSFVGPCPDHCEARHLNGDSEDNQLCNLRWGTATENWQDRRLHGRINSQRGSDHYNAKLTEAAVRNIRGLHPDGTASKQEVQALATSWKVNKLTIRDVIERRTWRHISG